MNSTSTPTAGSSKKLASSLLLVSFAAIAALVVWGVSMKRDLGRVQQELVALQQRPVPPNPLEAENRVLRDRVEDLETQLIAAAARVSASASKPAAAPVATTPANPAANLAALANTPAMRTMMATMQKRSVETRFAELFNQFQFTPEQRTRFVEILTENQAATTDAALKLAGGNLTPAEQAALRQEVTQLTQSVDPKIREFLGDETKFAAYKQFNEQQGERAQVTRLQSSLAQSGQPLSPAQASALTEVMYTERKSTPAPPEQNDPAAGLVPSADVVDRMMRRQQQLNEQVAVRAASILNPEQLAALRREQATRMEMMKASTDMTRQMLNGAPATAPR